MKRFTAVRAGSSDCVPHGASSVLAGDAARRVGALDDAIGHLVPNRQQCVNPRATVYRRYVPVVARAGAVATALS